MMTAKHFEKLATVIKDQVTDIQRMYRLDWQESSEYLMLEAIAGDIADVCESENARFDRARFLIACGVS